MVMSAVVEINIFNELYWYPIKGSFSPQTKLLSLCLSLSLSLSPLAVSLSSRCLSLLSLSLSPSLSLPRSLLWLYYYLFISPRLKTYIKTTPIYNNYNYKITIIKNYSHGANRIYTYRSPGNTGINKIQQKM